MRNGVPKGTLFLSAFLSKNESVFSLIYNFNKNSTTFYKKD